MNLTELITGRLTRLRFVHRFSTCHRVHNESVAEHSYYTALYCMFVGDWVIQNIRSGTPIGECIIDIDLLLRRALLHDIEESVTGDVVRTFKHSQADLELQIGLRAKQEVINITHFIWGLGELRDRYTEFWTSAKDCSIEGRILKFCDFLSVLSYMVQELTRNNASMTEHLETMQEYFQTFLKDESFKFLDPLIQEAGSIFDKYFLTEIKWENDVNDALGLAK